MPTRTRPTSLWEGPSTEELPRTRRSETFSRPVGVGELVPEAEAAGAAGVRAEERRGVMKPPVRVLRGQALPIGICKPPRNERGAVPYMSTIRDMDAVTIAGRRDITATSVRSPRGRAHLRVTLPRKSKSLVIVPGPGSRSYRVPTLPDPTGYYYCTLQLGCCIVVAICSVHLEVD